MGLEMEESIAYSPCPKPKAEGGVAIKSVGLELCLWVRGERGGC